MHNFVDLNASNKLGKRKLPVFPVIIAILILGIIFVTMQDITPESKQVTKIIEHEALK